MIRPKEVTLVSRTQPSGPLCLWQCFYLHICDFKKVILISAHFGPGAEVSFFFLLGENVKNAQYGIDEGEIQEFAGEGFKTSQEL